MASLVVPGQAITSEQGYLRGHGSYISETSDGPVLVSSVAGRIERVNKLIAVNPIRTRYSGEVGDLVVGRISTVDSKRWKVDINAQKDGILHLSSVTLPGGVQRMRTYEDQLQMRALFAEQDLVCAEVQSINSEGIASLHSRSLKYGKLENGQMISVSASLIRRLPQHYVSLPFGIDVILGKNGYIWVTRTIPDAWRVAAENEVSNCGDGQNKALGTGKLDTGIGGAPLAETLQSLKLRHARTPLLRDELLKVVRVCNCIQALSISNMVIAPETITSVYNKSIELNLQPKDILQGNVISLVTSEL